MAGFFQRFGIADLAVGKPGLYWLPISATVGDALGMLKELNLTELSIWDCSSEQPKQQCKKVSEARSGARKKDCRDCSCVGRVNIVDIVCFLADKVNSLDAALLDPVVSLLPASKRHIRHIDFDARLSEAFNLILDGVQYMVVPLDTRRIKSLKYHTPRSKPVPVEKHSKLEFCWLTQEDVLRFFLGCIGVFSPMPLLSIEDLDIINRDFCYVDVKAKAEDAVPLMMEASQKMSAVAVVETEEQQLKLLGDISLSCLKGCDETAALALATLSVSDFISYIQDTGAGSKVLKEAILSGMQKKVDSSSDDSSSDEDEVGSSEFDRISRSSSSSSSISSKSSKNSSSNNNSSNGGGLPQTCHPWSSLVAVMAQALAYRTSYLWVTDNENTLIGVVTYLDMINVLLNHLLSFQ